jgi:iron complex transport system substrate-binding protein
MQRLALSVLILAATTLGCTGSGKLTPVEMREINAPDGAKISVPVVVKNVYALNAAALDILVAVADPTQIQALPSTAFEYSSLADDPEPWRHLPQMTNVDTEDILALNPDLVLIHDWQSPTQGAWLRENGIAMMVLPTVTTWEHITASVKSVADALGREDAGDELLKDLEARRARLAERTTDFEPMRAMTYGNYGGSGSSGGSNTTWHLMIELAGLTNAGAEDGVEGPFGIDIERMLLLDPDLLLVSENLEGVSPAIATLRTHPSAQGLRALRKNQIVALPASLYSTSSLRVLDAAELLVDRLNRD